MQNRFIFHVAHVNKISPKTFSSSERWAERPFAYSIQFFLEFYLCILTKTIIYLRNLSKAPQANQFPMR